MAYELPKIMSESLIVSAAQNDGDSSVGSSTEVAAKSQVEVLREQIRALVTDYHAAAFPRREFDPGKSAVPVSGKVFDAEDIQHAVDASLDFWLTTGRFAEQFEREFARVMRRPRCSLGQLRLFGEPGGTFGPDFADAGRPSHCSLATK